MTCGGCGRTGLCCSSTLPNEKTRCVACLADEVLRLRALLEALMSPERFASRIAELVAREIRRPRSPFGGD